MVKIMNKLRKILAGTLVALGITGSEIYLFRNSLYKQPESIFYHYDHESYRFFDKDNNLVKVRKIEYPNLSGSLENFFECVYTEDENGKKKYSGDFLTLNNKLVHLNKSNYTIEKILDVK